MKTVRIYPASVQFLSEKMKDELFISALTTALNKLGVSYSYLDGNISYVVSDEDIFDASINSNSYPYEVACNLADKEKLQSTLAPHGFNTIESEIIKDANQITLENFIVKLRNGSGGNIVDAGKNWFSGIAFANKNEFIRHPLFDDMFIADKYIAQKAIGNVREHIAVSISGTVNSNGDTYFVRSSTDTWINSIRKKAVLSYIGYDEQKEKIQSFIKLSGIKNCAFMLQFIVDNDVFYPIDWNFRLGVNIPKQMISKNLIEYEKAIEHMVSDAQVAQYFSDDSWIVNF